VLSFSPEKLFIVGLIALVVLGPNRLPEAARTVGRFVATVRRFSSGFQAEMHDALAEPRDAFNTAMGDFRPPPTASRAVRDAITSTLSPPTPPAGGSSEGGTSAPPDPSGSPDGSCGLGTPDDPTLN
jgi:sec-independent protein translocase protein TatB